MIEPDLSFFIAVSILLSIVVFILVGKLYMMKKNLRSLSGQLIEINKINKEEETKLTLTMFGNDKDIRDVTVAINRSLETIHQLAATIRIEREEMRQEVTNISHDFRTPLTSIQGFVELILESDLSEEERMDYLQIVWDKIAVLSRITEAFYELSMYESNEGVLQLESVNLFETISETLLPFYHDFNQKEIQVNLEMKDKELSAFVDRSFMQRILINLIQNALRYGKSFFELIVIQEEETIKIMARNDHEGMEDVNIPSLFNRTHTFSNIRSSGQLGLGLYIVKELVEKQQGSIQATDDDGIFTICIALPR